jgi:hypothetical protein
LSTPRRFGFTLFADGTPFVCLPSSLPGAAPRALRFRAVFAAAMPPLPVLFSPPWLSSRRHADTTRYFAPDAISALLITPLSCHAAATVCRCYCRASSRFR